MGRIAILRFEWKGKTPLHSGYGSDFAEFVGDIKRIEINDKYELERKSANLKTRFQLGGAPEATFLASSTKGVFRTASAWLVERIAKREPGASGLITCDYIGDDAWKKSPHPRKVNCPVCQVYGGSGCRVDETYRSLSRVAFTFIGEANKSTDAAHPSKTVMQQKDYFFAHEQINEGKSEPLESELRIEQINEEEGKPLKIETLSVKEGVLFLALRLDPADDLAVALVCLAADLISSGFFRFGRFTSRGYGVVRLVPYKHFYGSLSDLLAADDDPCEPSEVGSGYELAKKLLGQDPLEVVKGAVRKYVGSER